MSRGNAFYANGLNILQNQPAFIPRFDQASQLQQQFAYNPFGQSFQNNAYMSQRQSNPQYHSYDQNPYKDFNKSLTPTAQQPFMPFQTYNPDAPKLNYTAQIEQLYVQQQTHMTKLKQQEEKMKQKIKKLSKLNQEQSGQQPNDQINMLMLLNSLSEPIAKQKQDNTQGQMQQLFYQLSKQQEAMTSAIQSLSNRPPRVPELQYPPP